MLAGDTYDKKRGVGTMRFDYLRERKDNIIFKNRKHEYVLCIL